MKGTLSNYDTDVFAPLLSAIEEAHGAVDDPVGLATSWSRRPSRRESSPTTCGR